MNSSWHFRGWNCKNQSSEKCKHTIYHTEHSIVANIVTFRVISLSILSPNTQPNIEASVENHPSKHTEHYGNNPNCATIILGITLIKAPSGISSWFFRHHEFVYSWVLKFHIYLLFVCFLFNVRKIWCWFSWFCCICLECCLLLLLLLLFLLLWFHLLLYLLQ